MHQDEQAPARLRWARLRFSIIGQLLASPPESGELASRIDELARTSWKHPTTGEALRFSSKTIERMYYAARGQEDPLGALERKVPKHAGTHPSVSPALAAALTCQYQAHPRWSYQLHHDNLAVLVKQTPSLGPMASYGTVCRFMKDHALVRERQRRRNKGKGSESEVVPRETRSYEYAHVNALWHFDFHEGKRKVLTATGERRTPYLFGVSSSTVASSTAAATSSPTGAAGRSTSRRHRSSTGSSTRSGRSMSRTGSTRSRRRRRVTHAGRASAASVPRASVTASRSSGARSSSRSRAGWSRPTRRPGMSSRA